MHTNTPPSVAVDNKILKSKAVKIRNKNYVNDSILSPGNGINAIAAMTIIQNAKDNIHHTNYAIKRMIASRLLFPPKKNINKFMIGGIAEECLNQLFIVLGYNSKNMSDEVTLTDLHIEVPIINNNETILHKLNVSIKNSCDMKSQIILENYRGAKRTQIRDLPPSFIVYTETHIQKASIIYIDHEIIKNAYQNVPDDDFNNIVFKNTDSNLCIRSGFIKYIVSRLPQEYILNIEYPILPPNIYPSNIVKLALNEVDTQIQLNNI